MSSTRRLVAGAGIPVFLFLVSGAWAQPAIRAVVTPAPNAAGWNNTPVTVTFVCDQAPACPDPVTVTEQGTKRVSGNVLDAQGRSLEAIAVVNIDTAPAVISLSPPGTGDRTTAAAVAISASLLDAASGVMSAFCNGDPARLAGTALDCTRPLQEGANVIIVSTLDAAGNSASEALTIWRDITPRAVQLSPMRLTIGVGQPARLLQLMDDSGRSLDTDVECQTRNASVIQVVKTDDGPCAVIGLAAGETVVSATWRGLSSTAAVTVLDVEKPPLGTILLELPQTPGFKLQERVQLVPKSDADLLLVESSAASGLFRVKAIEKTSRRFLSWEWPAMAPHEKIIRWMGDQGGGGLLFVQARGSARTAVVRIGHAPGQTMWRYESAGRLLDGWAMDWDGTLYIAEAQGDGFPHILAIDGDTGRAKSRLPLPRPLRSASDRLCAPTESLLATTPVTIGPATVPDGVVAAFAFIEDITESPCGSGDATKRYAIKLLRLGPDGIPAIRTLREMTSPGGPARFVLHLVVPDGHDAVLVPVRTTLPDGSIDNRIVRVDDTSDRVTEYTLPALGQYVLGEDHAYTSDGRLLVAFDPISGAVKWTSRPAVGEFEIKYTVRGGGVLVGIGDGSILKFDGGGGARQVLPPNTLKDPRPSFQR
jgi:hypothetical protein